MNLALSCLLILFILESTISLAGQRRKIMFGVNDLPAYKKLHYETFKILNRHSDKLEFEFMSFPNKRTFIVANDGLVDGTAMRPESFGSDEFTNLIRISSPLFVSNSIVAIHESAEDIPDLKTLRKHKVAMINGSVHAMNLVPPKQRIFVNSHLSGMLMVAHERIPAMLTLDIAYYLSVQESTDVAKGIKLASFSGRVPFYVFIHKKHKDLLPELEEVMRRVAVSGESQKVYDSIVEELKHESPLKK